MKILRMAAVGAVAALALTACSSTGSTGGGSTTPASNPTTTAAAVAKGDIRVWFVGTDTPQTLSRTPWGDPDLQGTWDFRSATPLERPAELAGKEFLTEAEAAEFSAKTVKNRNRDTNVPEGNVGDYNNFWYDYGSKVVGTRRTSLITDPKDGKIPFLTPEAQKKAEALAAARRGPANLPATRL